MKYGNKTTHITSLALAALAIAAMTCRATPFIDYDDGNAGNGIHDVAVRDGGFETDSDPAPQPGTFWAATGAADWQIKTNFNSTIGGQNVIMGRFPTAYIKIGQDTGHVLALGDQFSGSFDWRDASGWSSAQTMSMLLFYTDDDTLSGARTVLVNLNSGAETANDTWETETLALTIALANTNAVGQKLFVAFEGNNLNKEDYARLDNVYLFEGVPPAFPPEWTKDPISGTEGLTGRAYADTSSGKAIDLDGDAITYSKSLGAPWLVVDPDDSLFGIPDVLGTNSFTATAIDGSTNATLNIIIVDPVFPVWNTDLISGIRITNGQVDLTWDSQVNHEYTIMLSTNLYTGFNEFATVQSTPPLNTWREDLGHNARFYAIECPTVTNSPADPRSFALEINRRMGKGNNFMASRAMANQGAIEDYILLNTNYFHHCRIGYKMDEVAGAAPDYLIPINHMARLQKMVDWCLSQGLIANINPVHNWTSSGYEHPADLPKLSKIWTQVAMHFANYDRENVVFEIINEPRSDDNAKEIIEIGLAAIRGVPGNEKRVTIVSGNGFSTRSALINAFNKDRIPTDDNYLIGTFHYYDPRPFTKADSSNPSHFWGTTAEFAQVSTAFDAVLTANTNWAARHGTTPLPLYLGEFGVDNDVDNWGTARKKWLSWIRMQAESRGISWAHWNMYNTLPFNKGLGPWNALQINNPSTRFFKPDPVEALIGRYEAETGSVAGGVATSSAAAGYTGTGYQAFPTGSGSGIWARIDGIYIPQTNAYTVKFHYASETTKNLQLVTSAQTRNNITFPATGGSNSWKTLEVPISFDAGESADLTVVALLDEGVNLDWIQITY